MDHPHRRLSTTGVSLYETLGLQKGATTDEIKRSYRKLALQLHPDKNPGDHDKAERFKDISKSYAVLSDNSRKEIYDAYGSLGLYISEQFGEENVRTYFMLMSPWVKIGMLLIGCLTGCCCCCCLCCCCNFCCGKCKPPVPDDEGPDGNIEYDNLVDETLVSRDNENESVELPSNGTDHKPLSDNGPGGGGGDKDNRNSNSFSSKLRNGSSPSPPPVVTVQPTATESSPLKELGTSVPSYTTNSN